MSQNNQKLCPFSKSIISLWCICPYARKMEQCTGKMACHRESKFFQSCTQLVNILQDYASFILGITKQNTDVTPITHSKTMKIRCGGVLGIQRVMNIETNSPPVIPDIISLIAIQYGDIKNFPYNEIIQDIKKFNHRKSNKSH